METSVCLEEMLNAWKVLFQQLNSQFQAPGFSPESGSDADQRIGGSSQAGIKCAPLKLKRHKHGLIKGNDNQGTYPQV